MYSININILIIRVLIYLLTAIGLTPSGSSTVHIHTQTVHRTTQWSTIPRTEHNITEIFQCHLKQYEAATQKFLMLMH